MSISWQAVVELFLLAIPVAAVSWTVTHEELFSEFHDYCIRCSQHARRLTTRKFFFLFTCEYCFSHYVSLAVLAATRFTLLYPDWRGYLIAWFSLVWIANHYMGLYGRIKLGIRSERLDINLKEAVTKTAGVRKAG